MAAGYTNLDLEGQHFDTFPLLMDCAATSPADEHVVILNEHTASGDDPDRTDRNHGLNSSSDLRGDLTIPVGSLVRNSLSIPANNLNSTSTPSLRMIPSLGRHSDINTYGNRQRTSPLNSGLWISIELTITLSQIIASVIVLFLSRDENPQAPLAVWVIGYAAGCLATLPLLYWRYANRFAPQSEQDSVPSSASLPPSPVNSPHASHSLALPSSGQSEEVEDHPPVRQTHGSVTMHMRMGMFMERFKIALDCFFAVWFVVGNVWIFGGHSSSTEAPNLYRLCIAFLTFSCIGYAMPFILCATICCCLPCIITLLGLRENQGQTKGASSEVIDALPTYKFKSKGANRAKSNKDGNDSDSEGPGEGGFVAAGTERERVVLPEDAVCCICLGKYRDDDELRELPCTHFFHVECVDKWLKINASCPLCKHDITGKGTSEESTVETNEQSISLEVA